MQRSELEHVIRAAGAIAEVDELIVVGSQALLAQYPDAPPALLTSMEVDIFAPQSPEAADLIDGSIGEASPFHELFGYYAHGVGPETARLPARWKSRLIAIRNANTRGVTALCLHPADLAASKLLAGRDKDLAFVRGMLRFGLVAVKEIAELAAELENADAQQLHARLARCRSRVV